MSSNVAEHHNHDSKSADGREAASASTTDGPQPSPDGRGNAGSPKKRRKVNHACVYCRRSHMTCDLARPCTRCIKRRIGHLCRDEQREHPKKSKTEHELPAGKEKHSPPSSSRATRASPEHAIPAPSNFRLSQSEKQATDVSRPVLSVSPGTAAGHKSEPEPEPAPESGLASDPRHLREPDVQPVQLVQPQPDSGFQAGVMNGSSQLAVGYPDWEFDSQNQFQDMHTLHPSYMFNAPEVTHEYDLLNNFLNNSLLDDDALYSGQDGQRAFQDPSLLTPLAPTMTTAVPRPEAAQQTGEALIQLSSATGTATPRTGVADKARERTYYMTAADPSGSDPPEERMNKLLKAKYEAGLLKPFNYLKGYARLSRYLELNVAPKSRTTILRQLSQFRPKFRELMQELTDMQLVHVEMWFEQQLMQYDRVFASMAIPACCWRRTGEIFRGNKEMAELIHAPIEKLRDGRIAIHEILQEESLVSYWEKFGSIAFDNSQKAMLTSCFLKNPDPNSEDKNIHCCFSFTIRRDNHKIPSIIVGNFLPMMTG